MENLTGRRAIVTGATSGIGQVTATELAAKGAEVILAVRNEQKGIKTAEQIRAEYPNATVDIMLIDLSNLSSINNFAADFVDRYHKLDILINNAGVFRPQERMTSDGFDMQIGTNHLGHFALTGRLLPVIAATPNARVISLSSVGGRIRSINFDRFQKPGGLSTITYCQSKYANLLFAVELNNLLHRLKTSAISVACHPGVSATNLFTAGTNSIFIKGMRKAMGLFLQSQEMGALPSLYAATHPDLKGGEYIGPKGLMNMWGYPTVTNEEKKLYRADVAEKLWRVSEELTGVKYGVE